LKNSAAVKSLDEFNSAEPDRFLRLGKKDLRLAAELWARTRQKGRPTADTHALDIDVILAAQVLNLKPKPTNVVVATSNLKHLSLFVPAALWADI
jgi:hypothetical protein